MSNEAFKSGYEAAQSELKAWAKRKYEETGEQAWINFAKDFFHEIARAKLKEAEELERYTRTRHLQSVETTEE